MDIKTWISLTLSGFCLGIGAYSAVALLPSLCGLAVCVGVLNFGLFLHAALSGKG